MNRIFAAKTGLIIAGSLFIGSFSWASDEQNNPQIDALVNDTIKALMAEHRIPGMAVALSVDGKRYYFNYGVADQAANTPVTADTLFELGSVSKTFTAALGAYAQASGALPLNDSASQYLPALEGSVFDDVSLVELATYTAGGLPLQFPDDVQDEDEMLDYYRHWQPDYALALTDSIPTRALVCSAI